MTTPEPVIYERDGKWYRVLSDDEPMRWDDLAAWKDNIKGDHDWCAAFRIPDLVAENAKRKNLAFLRQIDPLTAAMRRALQNRKRRKKVIA